MRSNVSKLFLLLFFLIFVSAAWSVITDYNFTNATGTYTEISGGTIHGDATNDNQVFNAVPLGFDLNFNGTVYNQVSISVNGFIAMGPTVVSSNTAISSGTSNNVVSICNRDITSRANGQLMSLMTGEAPTRVFTIQWKNYRRYQCAGDTLNFQIKLHETTNIIKFAYGNNRTVDYSLAQTVQVGLRGAANTEYVNRTTTTSWTATTPGTANNANCRLNAAISPPNGLIFVWTPPQAGTAPFPAEIVSPSANAIRVAKEATLNWLNGGGTPTGYRVYFGTDNPPTNLVNGTTVTSLSYDPNPDMLFNTLYYWQIIPFNAFGDAVNCPVWSFTTMPDPTIVSYPYTQNWDTDIAPTVPSDWTVINGNGDANSWVLASSGAYSTPNAIRINNNVTVAMDDWFISPPLSLAADTFYKIQFRYKSMSATLSESMEVKLGTTNTVAGMTTTIFSNPNITNTAYALANVVIGPLTAGIYHLGWHGFSPADRLQLLVDDINISVFVPVFDPPVNLTATPTLTTITLNWQPTTGTTPVSYKVFRNDVQLTPTPITALTYVDSAVEFGINYTYTVKALYTNPAGESGPSVGVTSTLLEPLVPPTNLTATVNNYTVNLSWVQPGGPAPDILSDGFETYTDFAVTFAPWTVVDVDQSTTYGLTGVTFPGAYSAMAYMVFNPNTTVPSCAATTGTAHTGDKMAACWAATVPTSNPPGTGPNNDWLITPQFTVPANSELSLWVRSLTDEYGLERYKIGVSTTGTAPGNFTYLTGANYVTAPITWTQVTHSLAAYTGQSVYVGIQCLSNDAFCFFVDDVRVGEPTRGETPVFAQSITPALSRHTNVRSTGEAILPQVVNNPTRDFNGFKVYRNGVLISTITDPTTHVYADNNLLPNTYNYTVTATYSWGESVPVGPVQATVVPIFNAPSNLVGVANDTNVVLNWAAPDPIVGNLTGYKIFRNSALITPTPIVGTTFTDMNVVAPNQYVYYVKAVYTNPAGESAPSNNSTVQFGENLDPPTDLAATVAQNDITLTWVPPGGPILQDWIHYDDSSNDDGIGLNGNGTFEVAARFTQTELTGLHDRHVTKVRFFPNAATCTYTVKIYTGGTGYTNPGTVAVSIPVPNPVIGEWNIVLLPTPVQIPTTNELWFAVMCETTGGLPAGCDDGPSQPYKGNMVKINDAWNALSAITNPVIDVNWNIQAFVVNNVGEVAPLEPIREVSAPVALSNNKLVTSGRTKSIGSSTREIERSLTGYKVYRGGTLIATITNPLDSGYSDMDLANGVYSYTVTATYTGGESIPVGPVSAEVDEPEAPIVISDGFESYPNFSLSMPPWILTDVDQSPTAGIANTTYPNSGSPMAFMAFNPSATVPPLTNMPTHGGAKMAACFASTTPSNNDWMISPPIHVGTQARFSFWARSLTAMVGLERFKVGISNSPTHAPITFAFISGPNYLEAPEVWTEYVYDIPTTYTGQNVYIGLQCVSNNGSIFFVDDVLLIGYNTTVANEDAVTPVANTELLGNYPNPFNPETLISYNVKNDTPVSIEIYNLKGQRVKTLVSGLAKAGNNSVTWNGTDDKGSKVTSGVYFYRMTSGTYSSSRKMILMK